MGAAVGQSAETSAARDASGELVPPRPRAELRHISGRYFDHELGCTVARGIGFSWRCTCGARGRITGDRGEALAGKREHEAGHQR